MLDTLPSESTSSDSGVDEVAVGTKLAGYTIEALVARGGFARVYRARADADGSVVAIKLLHAELASTSSAIARFVREAEVLARIDHPHIVKVLAAGDFGARPYLVMEWLPGQTLEQEQKARGTFSLDELLGVLEELGSALGAAHAAGIVHRDLKPANVMVVPKGDWFDVKLVDFGIVRLVDEGHGAEAGRRGLTATGTIIGTPAFMSPEQLLGQKVDARADIYSLGLLTFVLLTGRPPFVAMDHTEVTEQHLFIPAPRISSLVAVPRGVDAAVARCLAKRPEDRYASVADFLDDLRAAIRGAEVNEATSILMGIHVDVAFDGPDDDLSDDVLERIDGALMRIERTLHAAGLDVEPAAGAALLASRAVQAGPRGAGARQSTLSVAVDLHDELDATLPEELLTYSLAVHIAPTHEELLDPRWTVNNPRGVLLASAEAVSNLESSFELVSSVERPDFFVVARRRQIG